MKVGDKMSELDDLQAGMLMRSHNELYAPRSPLHDHNLKRIPGDYLKWSKPFQDLADVVDIYRNPSFENVSNLLGGNHKVRSFYNNHVDPSSPLWTTIDTHATAAANLYPYGGSDRAVVSNFGNPNHKNSGVNGVYPVYQDAYEKVAQANGILPRELQSIVWEQMRKELNPAAKRMVQDAAKKAAEKGVPGPFELIWAKAEKGEITQEQAQKELAAEFEKWNVKANHGAAAKKRAAEEVSHEELQELFSKSETERMAREFEAAKKRGNEPLPERRRATPEAGDNPKPIHYPRPQRLPEEPF
jgi:negative regulator of genetic competence, sporulation and motility